MKNEIHLFNQSNGVALMRIEYKEKIEALVTSMKNQLGGCDKTNSWYYRSSGCCYAVLDADGANGSINITIAIDGQTVLPDAKDAPEYFFQVIDAKDAHDLVNFLTMKLVHSDSFNTSLMKESNNSIVPDESDKQSENELPPITLQLSLDKVLNHADCQFPLIEVFDENEASSKDIQHELGRNWRPHRINEIFVETMYPNWPNNEPLQNHNRYTIVVGSGPFGMYAVYCNEELKFVIRNPNDKWWKDFETRKIDLNPENSIQYEILD